MGENSTQPGLAITMPAKWIRTNFSLTLQRALTENDYSAQRCTSHASGSKAGQRDNRMAGTCSMTVSISSKSCEMHIRALPQDVEHIHMPMDTSHLSWNLLARHRVQPPQRSHGGRRCWQERQRIRCHAAGCPERPNEAICSVPPLLKH